MAYIELNKLYYGNNETYAQEYLNRFNCDDCVKIQFFIGEHQAFFLQNAEVMNLAYKIARLDKQIGKLCDALPGVAIEQYSKKCLINEIVITNKIEGVHSSRKEIGGTTRKERIRHGASKACTGSYANGASNQFTGSSQKREDHAGI